MKNSKCKATWYHLIHIHCYFNRLFRVVIHMRSNLFRTLCVDTHCIYGGRDDTHLGLELHPNWWHLIIYFHCLDFAIFALVSECFALMVQWAWCLNSNFFVIHHHRPPSRYSIHTQLIYVAIELIAKHFMFSSRDSENIAHIRRPIHVWYINYCFQYSNFVLRSVNWTQIEV